MKEPGTLRLRLRNTSCTFQETFKVLKVATNGFICNIALEHRDDHLIYSLEALSFQMLSEERGKFVVLTLESFKLF